MSRHPFRRIIGGTPEQRQVFSDELQQTYDAPLPEHYKEAVIETSPEWKPRIRLAIEHVSNFIEDLGVTPVLVPEDRVTFLKPESLKFLHRDTHEALTQPRSHRIFVEQARSPILTLTKLSHELLHLSSARSAQVRRDDQSNDLYRLGMQTIERSSDDPDHPFIFFEALEEALVAESNKRLFPQLLQASEFAQDIVATQDVIRFIATHKATDLTEPLSTAFDRALQEIACIPNAHNLLDQALKHSSDPNEQVRFIARHIEDQTLPESEHTLFFERRAEREQLYQVFDTLIASGRGEWSSHNDVFPLFAKANFSGSYLPLARVIEKTLGKGSFRKLAEDMGKYL